MGKNQNERKMSCQLIDVCCYAVKIDINHIAYWRKINQI